MSISRSMPRPWRAVAFLNHPDVAAWGFSRQDAVRLQRLCPTVDCVVCRERKDYMKALRAAHIALVWRFSDDELAAAPNLRVLATPAAGRDYFQVDLPARVTRFNGRFHGQLMSETAAAMVLGMTRGVLPAVTTYATFPWPRRELSMCMRPLRGTHVTILGFGRIGTAVARSLKPFGVRLTGVKRRVQPDCQPDFFDCGDQLCTVEEIDRVLPLTDHLVMVLPGGPSTDHLLDARRLALLPAHATVTNLGRGNSVDEEALVNALQSGRLAGACLDVFAQEPLPLDSPLRSCVNLWRMPHASAIAPNYLELFVDDFADQFRRWEHAERNP